jgi:hypothetical protein
MENSCVLVLWWLDEAARGSMASQAHNELAIGLKAAAWGSRRSAMVAQRLAVV